MLLKFLLCCAFTVTYALGGLRAQSGAVALETWFLVGGELSASHDVVVGLLGAYTLPTAGPWRWRVGGEVGTGTRTRSTSLVLVEANVEALVRPFERLSRVGVFGRLGPYALQERHRFLLIEGVRDERDLRFGVAAALGVDVEVTPRLSARAAVRQTALLATGVAVGIELAL